MMKVTFEVNNVDLAKREVREAGRRALMECGAKCENYAKIGAPVDTGRLRNSIMHQMEDELTVAIGSDVEYAVYQELGTSRGVKPKRYLTNALRNHIMEYGQIIINNLK